MIEIKINENVAELYTPYNQEFVSRIKQVDGRRWDGSKRCWTIPKENVNAAREIMMDVFGQTDLPQGKTLRLKVTVKKSIEAPRRDIILFGKCICHAQGRNSGGKAGDGVTFVKGRPMSGGSVKNWYSEVEEGAEIILVDVPEALYEKGKEDDRIEVEVITDAPDKEKLLAEKEALLKRLAEIEEELRKC